MRSGLIIEGGGMRGFFSAGILQVITEHNLEFPYAIGISSGSLNLLAFALDMNIDATSLFDPADGSFLRLRHLVAPGRGLLDTDRFFDQLPSLYPSLQDVSPEWQIAAVHAESASMHFWSLASIDNGEELRDRIRASASIPVLMPRSIIEGEVYVDGGIVESIPVRKALDDGVDKLVIILTRMKGYVKGRQPMDPYLRSWLKPYPKLKQMIQTRHLRYNETLRNIDQLEAEGKAFVFRPTIQRLRRMHYDANKAMYTFSDGKEIAQRRIDELKEFLGL